MTDIVDLKAARAALAYVDKKKAVNFFIVVRTDKKAEYESFIGKVIPNKFVRDQYTLHTHFQNFHSDKFVIVEVIGDRSFDRHSIVGVYAGEFDHPRLLAQMSNDVIQRAAYVTKGVALPHEDSVCAFLLNKHAGNTFIKRANEVVQAHLTLNRVETRANLAAALQEVDLPQVGKITFADLEAVADEELVEVFPVLLAAYPNTSVPGAFHYILDKHKGDVSSWLQGTCARLGWNFDHLRFAVTLLELQGVEVSVDSLKRASQDISGEFLRALDFASVGNEGMQVLHPGEKRKVQDVLNRMVLGVYHIKEITGTSSDAETHAAFKLFLADVLEKVDNTPALTLAEIAEKETVTQLEALAALRQHFKNGADLTGINMESVGEKIVPASRVLAIRFDNSADKGAWTNFGFTVLNAFKK